MYAKVFCSLILSSVKQIREENKEKCFLSKWIELTLTVCFPIPFRNQLAVLADYGIKISQCYSVKTDNGSNMSNAAKRLVGEVIESKVRTG
jgi:hypothetical protein